MSMAERNAKIVEWAQSNPCSSLQEIGDYYGITRERVRQIIAREGAHKEDARKVRPPAARPHCESCGKILSYRGYFYSQARKTDRPRMCRPCGRIAVACVLCGQMVTVFRNVLLAKAASQRRYKMGDVWCSECEHVRREMAGRVLANLPIDPATGQKQRGVFAERFAKEFDLELSHMRAVVAR